MALILTEETLDYQRWLKSFEELKEITEFVILYGSILNYPQEANDIDFLEMVSNKKSFLKIEKVMQRLQKTQIKKIHSEGFTKTELDRGSAFFSLGRTVTSGGF